MNQIGSVTESSQAAMDSKAAGWGVMVRHRSGETEDTFIADLAVGLASGQVTFFHVFMLCICFLLCAWERVQGRDGSDTAVLFVVDQNWRAMPK